jgi:hypothetical protein
MKYRFLYSFAPAFIIIPLLTIFVHHAAFADDQPIFCKIDSGKDWYFAVGRTVFEVKDPNYSTGGPLVGSVNSKYALNPPDPTAPVGCKGNPQQLNTFSALNWPKIEEQLKTKGLPKQVDLLQLYRYPNINSNSPLLDSVIERRKIEAIKCQNKKFIKRWDDGTILCSDTTGQLNPILSVGSDRLGIAWEFIISGNKYLTPLGENLVMSEDQVGVDVNYLLSPTVLVHYSWHPPADASSISPSYIMAIDTGFQKALSIYQISNYVWPSKN